MVDREVARRSLEELVAKRRDQGYTTATTEADIREQLIVPLLRNVLGWNTDDIREFSRERYSRGSGVADCVCLFEDRPVLYVEAKRLRALPGHEERRRLRHFYSREEEQALRYARRSTDMRDGERWTILTNFDRLRAFEATTEREVDSFDSPDELLERLDDLLLFSRDAIHGGGLRREFQLRGKPDIDEEFRDTLNEWRLRLARDIYERNPGVDLRLIQRSCQRLLDRLIVLQFAADVDAVGATDPVREILSRNPATTDARALVQPHPLKDELFRVSRRFDELHNTTLFAPGHPVEELEIGDDALRYVMESIAGQSFRRLDADILGATYETYLGHELRLVGGELQLDLRPDVRRRGGVYYTPRHVVDHIVGQTLQPLLASAQSVEEVDQIHVVDPSCGSGSFLIRAFEAFADWYEAENRRRAAAATHGQGTFDEINSSLPIRDYGRRILERNLYGVDIDVEAAEIATVNLIMQALRRSEGRIDLGRLPLLLGQNIKVGNSVVPGIKETSPTSVADWHSAHADTLRRLRDLRLLLRDARDPRAEADLSSEIARLSEDARPALDELLASAGVDPARRTPFHWPLEFPEVFDPDLPPSAQGFRVVLGNPPWQGFQGDAEDRPYLASNYQTTVGRFDVYVPFVELALGLLSDAGMLGYITPSNFLLRDYGIELRRFLQNETSIEQIVDWGHVQLFAGATNYSLIAIVRRERPEPDAAIQYLRESYDLDRTRAHRQADLALDGWIFLSRAEEELFRHLEAAGTLRLEDICRAADGSSGLAEGVITGQNAVFLLDPDQAGQLSLEDDFTRPCVKGEDVHRWTLTSSRRLLIYPYDKRGALIPEASLSTAERIYAWLGHHRGIPSGTGGLAGRGYFDQSNKAWYELWSQRTPALLDVPKLITPEVNDRPEFALAGEEVAFTNSVTSATPSAISGVSREFLAAQLNSRLLSLYHARHSVPKANGFLIYTPAFLKLLPVVVPTPGDDAQRKVHDELVELVREAIELQVELSSTNTDFAPHLGEFAVTRNTLRGLLGRFGAEAFDVLSAEPGEVGPLQASLDEAGHLTISGRVRFRGLAYAHGQYDEAQILSVRAPEPWRTFLLRYLPVWQQVASQAHRPRRAARRGPRPVSPTVATHVMDVLMPDISDGQANALLENYEPVLARQAELIEGLAGLERLIETKVWDLFQLTDPMRETVRDYRSPAELLGSPDTGESQEGAAA